MTVIPDPEVIRWVEFPAPGIVYLDVYLDLPPSVLALAHEYHRRLSRFGRNNIDWTQGAAPHVTLFMGLFPETAVTEIRTRLDLLTQQVRESMTLRLDSFSASREGYVFWNVARDPSVMARHRDVVAALNPLREGMVRTKFRSAWTDFSAAERSDLATHGFPWVLDHYAPHLTLGVLTPEQALAAVAAMPTEAVVATVETIGLGAVGDWGTVVGSLGRWPMATR